MPSREPIYLVGRRIEDNENLGLGYLRAALEASGRRVEIVYVNRAAQALSAAAQIAASRSPLVGLSIPDGRSAFIPLALGEILRRRRYAGHITCGGQFATLARRWLLARYEWLDSVVRLAGEVPIVDLADTMERGDSLDGVRGLTTRAGDGLPSPVMDTTCTTITPCRGDLPEILGHRAAHLSSTRGCKGRCAYCGPASIQKLELAEAKRAGVRREAALDLGVGGVRRRRVDSVCDEMEHLWKDRGVRYFYFVDEHFLPYREDEALDFLDDFEAGLARRGVGPFGFGAMLRNDRLTGRIADRLANAGLVRLFAGLELATPEEARSYGRNAPTGRDLELIQVFGELGVATVSNLMLVHPDSTIDTIRAGIDLLGRLPSGVFEVTRMMVYHGTRLHERMERAGRLTGNPLRYGYEIEDPAAARFSRIFNRLRGEAFWDYSLAYRTHDVFLSLALARRLYPGKDTAAFGMRMEAIRARVNRLYLDTYREALSLSEAGRDWSDADDLAHAAKSDSAVYLEELEEIEADLMGFLSRPARRFAPIGNAAAAVFSFAMMGTAAACNHAGGLGDDAGATDGDTDSDADTDADTDSDTDPECTYEEIEAQKKALAEEINEEVPCFEGHVYGEELNAALFSYKGVLNGGGVLAACSVGDPDHAADVEEAVDPQDYPCFSDMTWMEVEGGFGDDVAEMSEAILGQCGEAQEYGDYFTIAVDADGYVADVFHEYGDDPHMNEVVECVLGALDGLKFPCLTGYEICPEYIIAE